MSQQQIDNILIASSCIDDRLVYLKGLHAMDEYTETRLLEIEMWSKMIRENAEQMTKKSSRRTLRSRLFKK